MVVIGRQASVSFVSGIRIEESLANSFQFEIKAQASSRLRTIRKRWIIPVPYLLESKPSWWRGTGGHSRKSVTLSEVEAVSDGFVDASLWSSLPTPIFSI